MGNDPMAIATAGLEAWRSGDFDAVESILHPAVEWGWFEPGEWDCHNRDDVMRTLRERYEQGFAKGRLEFKEGGEDAVIVVSHPSEIGGPSGRKRPQPSCVLATGRWSRCVTTELRLTRSKPLARESPFRGCQK